MANGVVVFERLAVPQLGISRLPGLTNVEFAGFRWRESDYRGPSVACVRQIPRIGKTRRLMTIGIEMFSMARCRPDAAALALRILLTMHYRNLRLSEVIRNWPVYFAAHTQRWK